MKYDSEEYRKFEQEVRDAAKLIDPATAEMMFHSVSMLDPYGVVDRDPEDKVCVGRAYFVRAPNSDIWVWTYDLPQEIFQEVRQLQDAGYYNHDRRAERLAQRVHKLEAQLQSAGRLLGSLEGETADSNLADQARQLRLDLAESETGLAELRRVLAADRTFW